jgi:DNA-binding transcriptional MerR regulator
VARSSKRSGGDKAAPQTQQDIEEEADDPVLLSLEQVSEQSGLAPRTIRYYQTKKLLPRTIKDPDDGRVVRYTDDHVERLRLIGELHDRGLKLPAIKELLDSSDPQSAVTGWLGLNDSLRGSWSGDSPALLSRSELDELLAPTPPGTLGTLEEKRMVTRQGDAWLVPNPALFKLALGLVANDIAIDLVLEAGDILQRHLHKASAELIKLFVTALDRGFADDANTDPGTLVHSLRPVAGDAARMIFGRELEREIEKFLADTKRLS